MTLSKLFHHFVAFYLISYRLYFLSLQQEPAPAWSVFSVSHALVSVLVLASPTALPVRQWFPGCLSAATVHGAPADREMGVVCPQGLLTALSAGSERAPREMWCSLTALWAITLSVDTGA